ncbi:MAG TPA: MFS transporter, partial [Pyrinomonadaceae bacterium]|nr:MFS transporter [Pyrinomonadaceae bacterium]
LSFFGTFFEAAKNAAVPNITGERDLLAGNALMFSSRFLFMSIGAALGGWTAAHVGYQAAFIINAASFVASAYSVWLVPEADTRSQTPTRESKQQSRHRGYWNDIKEGWSYIVRNRPVAAILGVNVLWATGGGAINLIAERLGALVFASQDGIRPDSAVAALYFAGGLGLFGGMIIARRVGIYFEHVGKTTAFIGWSLFFQGVIFAFIGVMPTLWLACVLLLVSRILLGAEFAVQETILMRLVPDTLRGRVSTTDRATELLIWTLSTVAAGWSLYRITPRTLTVISGLLSSVAGVVWLILFWTRVVTLPRRFDRTQESPDQVAALTTVE